MSVRRSLPLMMLTLVLAASVACQPDPPTTPVLREVRLGVHPGFDRVVFEFGGAVPGVTVTPTPPPVYEDGSGREVAVAGESILLVRLEPASAHDPVSGAATYGGPRRLPMLDGGVVTEVVMLGDFEGVVTWAIGLRHPVEAVTRTLSDPARVVVDLPTSVPSER